MADAGKETSIDLVAVDWDVERQPDKELDVQVIRHEWVNTFVEDEAGGGRWSWETKETLVDQGALTTDGNATGVVRFTPEQGGSYHVVVQGRDSGERLVRSSIFVWVSGDTYVSWRRENNDRITLIQSGKNLMTPFQGILTPKQVEAVAKYSMELK